MTHAAESPALGLFDPEITFAFVLVAGAPHSAVHVRAIYPFTLLQSWGVLVAANSQASTVTVHGAGSYTCVDAAFRMELHCRRTGI